MTANDFYAILGVPPSASARTIRDAYLGLVRRLHPDRVGPEGTARFQEVTEAYEILSDPAKRRMYDRRCEHIEPSFSTRAETLRARTRVEPLIGEPVSILGEPDTVMPSIEEVFERFIRNFTEFGRPKSEHIEGFDLGVILNRGEARRGAVLPVAIPVLAMCEGCGGLGGTILACPYCNQRGRVVRDAIVRVRIPPMVRDGTVIEVPLERIGVTNLFLRVHVAVQEEGTAGL